MQYDSPIRVAVGVIENQNGEILIAKRDINKDQGGLWEFPGGKIDQNESEMDALYRELHEELDIEVLNSRPLITIHHQYAKYSVTLCVHKIIKWQGDAIGNEGQEIKWLHKNLLISDDFPEANKTIIKAAQLADIIFVTPEPDLYEESFFIEKFTYILKQGIKLIQFRSKQKHCHEHMPLLIKLKKICEEFSAKLIINTDIEFPYINDFDGLHLSSKDLKKYDKRPINNDKILMASCHSEYELEISEKLDIDAIILGSVKETNSHPDGEYMGWNKFKDMAYIMNIPVYAIGGLKIEDKSTAWNNGAQGIAMITGLWDMQK